MLKQWLKSPSGETLTAWIASAYMNSIFKTIRRKSKDYGGRALMDSGDVFILVNWHSRLLGIPVFTRGGHRIAYMTSPSRDGRIMAMAAQHFDIDIIWGSGSQKAVSGYRTMRRRLDQGLNVGIHPDGPRGPARKVAPGAIMLAKTSGVPLIPIAWSTSRMTRSASWDRLAIPKFFTKGIQLWGKPIMIPKDADKMMIAQACLDLEDALNDLTAEADAYFGHPADHAERRYGDEKGKRS